MVTSELAGEGSREALMTFLEEDELRHVSPLKMLLLFGDALKVFSVGAGDERGYVMTMPCAASHWASQHYPGVTWVVHIALREGASAELIAIAAERVLRDTQREPFVVVTVEPRLTSALQASGDARAPLAYRLALLTFVPTAATMAIVCESVDGSIRNACHTRVPDDARNLLASHNTASDRELETIFADGNARCWVRFVDGEPVAVLLTFANSKSLHEIGSLHVAANYRRAGHARALVGAALADLRERGLSIRYVANATNEASIALAQQCGLRLALRSEHWVSR